MPAILSPVPVNWPKTALLTSVRIAIAREMRCRTFDDLAPSERYDELVEIERRLMADVASTPSGDAR